MLRVALTGVCVAICLAGTAVADDDKVSAFNPDLVRAKVALDKVDFDEALASLTRALERGGNPPDQLAEIYLLLGEVYITVGKVDDAEDYFGRLLMLRPYAKLSPGASPKLTDVLESVRRSLQDSGALQVRAKLDRKNGTVTLVRDSDPLKLVYKAVVQFERASTSVPEQRASEPGELVVRVPREPLRNVELIAVDEWGNHVHVLPLGDVSVDAGSGPPVWQRWQPWAIAAGAFVTVGVISGIGVRGAQDDLDALRASSAEHFFSEFESARSRGRRDALIANISFGLAVASTATSAYLFLRQRARTRERRPAPKPVVAVPFVGQGSVGLGLVGRFD